MMRDQSRKAAAVAKILRRCHNDPIRLESWSYSPKDHTMSLIYEKGKILCLSDEVQRLKDAFLPEEIEFTTSEADELEIYLSGITWPWER